MLLLAEMRNHGIFTEEEEKKQWEKLLSTLFNCKAEEVDEYIKDGIEIKEIYNQEVHMLLPQDGRPLTIAYSLKTKDGKIAIFSQVHYHLSMTPPEDYKIIKPLGYNTIIDIIFDQGIIKNDITLEYSLLNLQTGEISIEPFNGKIHPDYINNDYKSSITFITEINGLFGRKDITRHKRNIPEQYIELQNLVPEKISDTRNRSILEVIKCKDAISKKYAIHCFWLDSETTSDYDGELIKEYSYGVYYEPIFDDLEIYQVYNKRKNSFRNEPLAEKVYLKVTISGKQGIIEAFTKRVIVPPIFDRIEEKDALSEFFDKPNYFFGWIGSERYIIIAHNEAESEIFKIESIGKENERAASLKMTLEKGQRQKLGCTSMYTPN